MSLAISELPSISEVAKGVGSDGHTYIVRPLEWTVDKVEEYWKKFAPHHIFSDFLPDDSRALMYVVMQSRMLWYEVYDETADDVVGVMYLSDFVPRLDGKGFIQANWHATVWDAKAQPRRPIAAQAIAHLMDILRIHRLIAEIPADHLGAIRNAVRLGFTQEGVERKARQTLDGWHDVVLLSLLDDEVGVV